MEEESEDIKERKPKNEISLIIKLGSREREQIQSHLAASGD